MKKSENISSKLLPWLTTFILLIIWEAGVKINNIPEYILPGPLQVIKTTLDILPLLVKHTITTLFEAMLGFALSVIIAFGMAFLLDNIEWLKKAVYPLLIVSQTIPLIVLAVLFTIWFGFGPLPKILVVILVCFFPIVISLINGLNSVDPDQLKLFRSMGASRVSSFKMVKLPAAMPSFFSGLRISATYSIMAAIIGEWLGSTQGLGYFMTLQQKSFHIDQVLAAVIVICILSLLVVKIVDLIEYLLIPWNRQTDS